MKRLLANTINGGAALLAALLLFSCGSSENENDPKVARAYDEILYRSDIQRMLPKDVGREDSIKLVTTLINNWLKDRAELAQAELNLSDQQKDFDERLEDYYRDLVIYAYENELLRQKLDPDISEEEIQEHYLANEREFELHGTIVKVKYLCASELEPEEIKIVERAFFDDDDESDASEIRVICEQRGARYFDGGDQWMPLSVLIEKLQFDLNGDPDELLKDEKHRISSGDELFFVHFVDHKLKGSLSPLSLERDKIREIIMNRRKIELIEKMQKAVLEDALKKGDVQIYE